LFFPFEPSCNNYCIDQNENLFRLINPFLFVLQAFIESAQSSYAPQLLSADGTLTGYENLLISAGQYYLPCADGMVDDVI
jgi:hypothetical protein